MSKKFNPDKLDKLNNPERLIHTSPDYILEKLKLGDCRTIVDIGAGTGLFSKAFLSLTGAEKVYAADISPVMIDWMNDNLSVDNGEIIPLLMDEAKVSLENETVDLVLMLNLYHELEQPDSILKEAARILRSGGKICIVDWKKEETPFGPPPAIRVSGENISKDLVKTGFSSVKIDGGLKYHSLVWGEK